MHLALACKSNETCVLICINVLPLKDTGKHSLLQFDSFGGGRKENIDCNGVGLCSTSQQEYQFFFLYAIYFGAVLRCAE